jgi:hypothetical protein
MPKSSQRLRESGDSRGEAMDTLLRLLGGAASFPHGLSKSAVTAKNMTAVQAESMVHFLGLNWSLATLVQLVMAIIGLTTIIFIAYQTYLSRRAGDAVALQMRYQMIFETNKFLFDNPEFIHKAVRGGRYGAIKAMSLEERRSQAAWDLIMDNFEFYFLIGLHEDEKHAERLLRAFLGNPEIRKFMDGPTKGIFRREFEKIVHEELARTGLGDTISARDSSAPVRRPVWIRAAPKRVQEAASRIVARLRRAAG